MHRAFLLPIKPVHNAVTVELAQALEAGQSLPNLIVLHADCALRWLAIPTKTVLLRGYELKHAGFSWGSGQWGPLLG
jgi:hypothetical protein